VEKIPEPTSAMISSAPEPVPIVEEKEPEKSEPSPAEEEPVPVRSVKFAEPTPEPPRTNHNRGKKVSKFKSSRMASKK
jgi:hypothetical protein